MEEEHHVVSTVNEESDLRLEEDASEPRDIEQGGGGAPEAVETASSEEGNETEVAAGTSDANETDGVLRTDTTSRMTLAELEEERELSRRRASGCVMLAAFVLFRLWLEALATGDVGLLMLALVGTSWTARWMQYNREREEELDRRIAAYVQNNGGDAETTTVDRNDLRMLSFQAQLALAIMESQRQMMDGGHGHPGEQASPGVSEEAQSRWTRFTYKDNKSQSDHKSRRRSSSNKHGYGSVPGKDDKEVDDEEEPHCSICLGEYETDEQLVKLPCSHVYHDECISSWTSNHTKCPLCNADLESVSGTAEDSASAMDDSIV